jgi:hypothetical protein
VTTVTNETDELRQASLVVAKIFIVKLATTIAVCALTTVAADYVLYRLNNKE